MMDLLLQLWPLQRKHTRDHCQAHKLVIFQQLRRRECAQCIDEKLARALELSDGEEVESFVDFESVATVPVSALFNQSGRRRERG